MTIDDDDDENMQLKASHHHSVLNPGTHSARISAQLGRSLPAFSLPPVPTDTHTAPDRKARLGVFSQENTKPTLCRCLVYRTVSGG